MNPTEQSGTWSGALAMTADARLVRARSGRLMRLRLTWREAIRLRRLADPASGGGTR